MELFVRNLAEAAKEEAKTAANTTAWAAYMKKVAENKTGIALTIYYFLFVLYLLMAKILSKLEERGKLKETNKV